jgi:Virulence factor BrkB
MVKSVWSLLKETVTSFIDDDALSRGASMAFYAVTSLAPILLIVVAIAGLAFGEDAARNAVAAQFEGLMGHQSASLLQGAMENAGQKSSGILATVIGVITLLVTPSWPPHEPRQADPFPTRAVTKLARLSDLRQFASLLAAPSAQFGQARRWRREASSDGRAKQSLGP